MSIEATHPQYDIFCEDWEQQRDLYRGERAVKAKGEKYLPPTPGMILDGMKTKEHGWEVYQGYKKRAVFPEYIFEAVATLVGMLNHKAATIELPAQMEPLREKATLDGESLQALLRRIHIEQLVTGRCGLLSDMPANPDQTNPMPYLALYISESIKNWDDAADEVNTVSLNLVVLDESGYTREDNFTWKTFKRFRVLQLGDIQVQDKAGTAVYTQGVFDDIGSAASLAYDQTRMAPPMLRGATLNLIPFTFINTRDLLTTPDEPPLLGLGKQVLAIYRGEADYRQGLFLTGQDTLVVIGGVKRSDINGAPVDEPLRTGAGARIDVEAGGDAKYIGVNSQGLSEQRQALASDRQRAETRAGQLIPAKSNVESGEALKTRMTAQTATLNEIALTSALGLQGSLRNIATWMGLDPETVKVTPNLEFGEVQLEVADIDKLMDARTKGAPLSKKSIHALMVDRRLTTMTYENEVEQIAEEDAQMPRTAQGAATLTADEQLEQQNIDRETNQANAEADRKLAEKAASQKAGAAKAE